MISNMTSIPAEKTVEKKKPGNWWVPISMVLYTFQGFVLWASISGERKSEEAMTAMTGIPAEPVRLTADNLMLTLAGSLGANLFAVIAILLCAFKKSCSEKWVLLGIGVLFILVGWVRPFF